MILKFSTPGVPNLNVSRDNGFVSVAVWSADGARHLATISMTPSEARVLAKLLIEESRSATASMSMSAQVTRIREAWDAVDRLRIPRKGGAS